jgi:hypothetical protein
MAKLNYYITQGRDDIVNVRPISPLNINHDSVNMTNKQWNQIVKYGWDSLPVIIPDLSKQDKELLEYGTSHAKFTKYNTTKYEESLV